MEQGQDRQKGTETEQGKKNSRRSRGSRATPKDAQEQLVRRMPPYNEEAEQAVLAALMLLYDARAPLSPQALAEKLLNRKLLEAAGGTEYLFSLFDMQVVAVNGADFYAPMVRNKSMQRTLINTCAQVLTSAYDTPYDMVSGLLDDAEHRIFQIAENSASSNDLKRIIDLRDAFYNKLEANAKNPSALTGVTTGFVDLDRQTGGLQASDLIIVAARPSMGKTAFSLNLALNAAQAGHKVAFFSLEMSSEQLLTRLISMCAQVPMHKIRQPRYLTDEEWKAVYYGADKLGCDLYVDDTPALKTMDLRAKARRIKARSGLDLIVVDYLQLMRPSRPLNSRELEISEISRTLKSLAKELDIPVIALSQLNRKLEERTDKRPMLSDLRESGAIEQDADVIMFLYRDDVYSRKKKTDEIEAAPQQRLLNSPTEVIIGKQRNGPVGTVNLLYKCEYTCFVDLAEDYMASPSENGILK